MPARVWVRLRLPASLRYYDRVMRRSDDSAPPADEFEPRVASFTDALIRSWWVVVLLVLVGAAAGALFTLLADDEYSATASVYIGQTTDANGNPMAGLSSNVRAAAQLLDSEAVRQSVAGEVDGMTAGQLRRATSIETPSQAIRTTQSLVNFVTITVTHTDAQVAADAANLLAEELLARVTPTAAQRVALLEAQEEEVRAALEASRARSRLAERELDALREGGGADEAAAAAPYLTIVQASASEQQSLLSSLQKLQLMLQVAQTTEQPRLLHEAAVPSSPSGPSLTLNVAAGALAGLVVGIVLAFVRARLQAPRRAASAATVAPGEPAPV
jgi:capsular polysaccharide biosynthesis protein